MEPPKSPRKVHRGLSKALHRRELTKLRSTLFRRACRCHHNQGRHGRFEDASTGSNPTVFAHQDTQRFRTKSEPLAFASAFLGPSAKVNRERLDRLCTAKNRIGLSAQLKYKPAIPRAAELDERTVLEGQLTIERDCAVGKHKRQFAPLKHPSFKLLPVRRSHQLNSASSDASVAVLSLRPSTAYGRPPINTPTFCSKSDRLKRTVRPIRMYGISRLCIQYARVRTEI